MPLCLDAKYAQHRVFCCRGSTFLSNFCLGSRQVWGIAADGNGERLATVGDDGKLVLWRNFQEDGRFQVRSVLLFCFENDFRHERDFLPFCVHHQKAGCVPNFGGKSESENPSHPSVRPESRADKPRSHPDQ